jgi:DNA polymerase III subunit alpha, Gram-positive type
MLATVFDTETTGLIINPARKLDAQPEIISISIQSVDLATAEISESYYKLFKPTRIISEEITKITNITNDMVIELLGIKHYIREIATMLEDAPLLIGQNISFDMAMVSLECRRYGKIIRWPKTLDLVENTIHLKGYRLSLTNLHIELFGAPFDSAHRADVDVQITIKCAIELFKRGLL